jgi:hypothetical protein
LNSARASSASAVAFRFVIMVEKAAVEGGCKEKKREGTHC